MTEMQSTLYGKQLPLLGVSIEGPAPLGAIDLPMYSGVTVLYGRNGIGKSRVLNALRQALSGQFIGGNCWVHLEFPPEVLASPDPGRSADPLIVEIARAIELDVTLGYQDVTFGEDLSRASIRSMVELIVRTSVDDIEDFVAEVASQGFFSLEPTGHSSPSWDLWFSVLPNEDTPNLSRIFDVHRRRMTLAEELGSEIDSGERSQEDAVEVMIRFNENEKQNAREKGLAHPDLTRKFDRATYRDRAPWAPTPLAFVGRINNLGVGFAMTLSEDAGPKLAEMSLRLVRTCKPVVTVVSEDEVEPSDEAAELLIDVSREADSNLHQVLGSDAPVMSCRLEPWGVAPPAVWEASDYWSSTSVPIASLGSGRSRWAIMAAHLALVAMGKSFRSDEFELNPPWIDRVVLVDEPELGLHPTAESQMFDGLHSWGRTRTVVAATHSAVALRDRTSRLVHVDRDQEGHVICNSMSSVLQDLFQRLDPKIQGQASDALGLDPADLLQSIRKFVIVEGEHDVAVIEATIGLTELSAARATILPMRGANNLMSILGAQLIFDYTSASILVVVDRTNGALFEEVWAQAKSLYESGNTKRANEVLRKLERGTAEEQKLSEFCQRALRTGKANRIQVFGLQKPDIIEYLPVTKLVKGADSWAQVVSGWRSWQNVDAPRNDFKSYLRDQLKARLSTEYLREVAGNMDQPDPEFAALRQFLLGEITP